MQPIGLTKRTLQKFEFGVGIGPIQRSNPYFFMTKFEFNALSTTLVKPNNHFYLTNASELCITCCPLDPPWPISSESTNNVPLD